MPDNLLWLKNLGKRYPQKYQNESFWALRKVNLTIEAGSSWGIVGPSGAGKSTLASLVLGLSKPDQGKVFFKGSDISLLGKKQKQQLKKKIQIVWQDPRVYLNPYFKAKDLISELMHVFDLGNKNKRMQTVLRLIDQVGLASELLDHFPHELSGGQCQKVALARALSCGPELLILDEALSGLEGDSQIRILDLLKKMQKKQNLTILFISHDLFSVNSLCQNLCLINNGTIVEKGSLKKIIDSPVETYTEVFLQNSLKFLK